MLAPLSEGEGVVDGAQESEVDRWLINAVDEDEDECNADEAIGDEEETEGAIEPVALRDPGQPTAKERAEHELTHQPPRPWCDFCSGGRGQHDHHRAIPDPESLREAAIPTISLDYCFMADFETRANRNPVLVKYENRGSMIGAWQT